MDGYRREVGLCAILARVACASSAPRHVGSSYDQQDQSRKPPTPWHPRLLYHAQASRNINRSLEMTDTARLARRISHQNRYRIADRMNNRLCDYVHALT
jgi:hypothetical protein